MEQVFAKLEKEGKNTIGELTKWLKDSKVIEATKDAEDKVRQLFGGGENTVKVTLAKFKEVVQKLASEKNKTFEDISKTLASAGGGNIGEKVMAGISSLKNKFMK